MNQFKICLIGAGQFGTLFVPLFRAHPGISEVAICDADQGRLAKTSRNHGLQRVFTSVEEVLRSDIDAVAIFTQRHTHAPLALQALRAGKHVYCAVPAATTLEELAELIETVRTSGLTYMMGETSQYYGATMFCRDKWEAGAFGDFVYGEGEYYHDMAHGFYDAFRYSGGRDWKKVASYPPMLYPTHSVAMVLSVTGARMTSVTCLGFKDRSDDGIFRADVSAWKNVFSNQAALFRTSDGGMARINEFRRIGLSSKARSVRLSLYGSKAAFEEQCGMAAWVTHEGTIEDVEPRIRCGFAKPTPEQQAIIEENPALKDDFAADYAEVHQKARLRLPAAFSALHTGHQGSHHFLVDDFVTAVLGATLPPVHIWQAARYNAPGIVAHQSSLRDGEHMAIPDLGWPTHV